MWSLIKEVFEDAWSPDPLYEDETIIVGFHHLLGTTSGHWSCLNTDNLRRLRNWCSPMPVDWHDSIAFIREESLQLTDSGGLV